MANPWTSQAREWAEHDPDPTTQAQLRAALEQGDQLALAQAFAEPLAFGTAGLRGAVGPGPARMNQALILRVSWALAVFLERQPGYSQERPLLIGFDGRAESGPFAHWAAEVHRARGQTVWLLPRPGPTPWVAFGVRHFKALAGVAVTPSHNPRGDAGYKLFDASGIQIVAPWDVAIAELLAQAPPADQIPRTVGESTVCPPELWTAYDEWLDELASQARGGAPRRSFAFGYTPLHGIGLEAAERSAARQGCDLRAVLSQKEPDGTFPTTPFPNPEEPGTLDALLELVTRDGLDLGVANDPDADRFAVCCPRLGQDQSLRPLSGDQLGLVLADAWLERAGVPASTVVSTLVSSPGLEPLASLHGAQVIRTLTGFKWMGRPALDAPGFVFSYEEALGYCFARGPRKPVLDKDGIAALTVLLGTLQSDAEQARRQGLGELGPGRLLALRLASLASRIGLWASVGQSLRFESLGAAATLVARLRQEPPQELGGLQVTAVTDFSVGAEQRPAYLGQQELLLFDLAGGARVAARPSGTEPKLKFYAHYRQAFEASDDYSVAERIAVKRAGELASALSAWVLRASSASSASAVQGSES